MVDTDLEITEVLVLSTGHMTREDNKLLKELSGRGDRWQVYSGGTGFFVWVGEYDHIQFSQALRDALYWAQEQGYDWVRFDRDGPVYHCLETHDW